jgi:hypothetical protein
MTPREKANKIVDTFRMFADGTDQETDRFSPKTNKEDAMLCALIAVDIILNAVGATNWENDTMTNNNYWIEVKNEINLL